MDGADVVIAVSFIRRLYLGLERGGRIPTPLLKIFATTYRAHMAVTSTSAS
jgi:hypothetical protein